MITYREFSTKNHSGFVFNSMTNIKGLDISLVSVNQISFLNDDAVILWQLCQYSSLVSCF